MAVSDVKPNDPAAILQRWQELMATGAHLHPPEIARQIGVSEAALVASRIGSGATRLQPDIAGCLTPVESWGRVLCAFSVQCGVHMPLGRVSAEAGAQGRVVLRGAHMVGEVNKAAIAEAMLFIDWDENHGNTRSLQFFDAQGAAVLKVFIFHKGAFAAAQTGFDRLIHTDQSRHSVPVNVAPVRTGLPPWAGEPLDDAQAVLDAALPEGTPVQIRAEGRHAHVTWMGALKGRRFGGGMIHLHEQTIRSHLRLKALTHHRAGSGLQLGSDAARFLSISPWEGAS